MARTVDCDRDGAATKSPAPKHLLKRSLLERARGCMVRSFSRDCPNLTLTSVLRQPEFVGLWIRRSGMDNDLLTAEHCSGATRGERQCAPLPFVEYGLGTTVFAKRAGRQPGGSLRLVRLGKRDMTPTRIRGRLKVKSVSRFTPSIAPLREQTFVSVIHSFL